MRNEAEPAGGAVPDGARGSGGAGGSDGAGPVTGDPLADRVRANADRLAGMVARAEAVQRDRADETPRSGAPRWTDVFTTQFTEFSNRPR